MVGNIVAYRRRADPWPGVKPVLAICAVGGFVWFLLTVTHHATPGDIASVEAPLAVLFAWVLSTHAFDVPSRRDVAYSLAGSTALIAVAAAQSVDLTLGAGVGRAAAGAGRSCQRRTLQVEDPRGVPWTLWWSWPCRMPSSLLNTYRSFSCKGLPYVQMPSGLKKDHTVTEGIPSSANASAM